MAHPVYAVVYSRGVDRGRCTPQTIRLKQNLKNILQFPKKDPNFMLISKAQWAKQTLSKR